MPKYSTIPTILEYCKTISIANLKEWGYLEKDMLKTGVITWTTNGQQRGSISITTNIQIERPYLQLDYTSKGIDVSYQVELILLPSNLGKGHIWFFICPDTKKHCRKLYCVGTYFLHRNATKGCIYERQTESKRGRAMASQLKKLMIGSKASEQITRKYFKKYYNGLPTKRYAKLWKKIYEASDISASEILDFYKG